MKRNTLGRSAGGLSNAKAPPARAQPACMHGACTRNVNFFVAPTYLSSSSRPSIRPSMPPVPSWPSRTRGAPFVRMLMPAAFRDAIQFSSLTPADLFLQRAALRVKVRGPFRRRQTTVSSRRIKCTGLERFCCPKRRNLLCMRAMSSLLAWIEIQFPCSWNSIIGLTGYSFATSSGGFRRNICLARDLSRTFFFRAIFFFRSFTEDWKLRLIRERVSEKCL